MRELLLLRHGQVEQMAQGRYYGHADIPLSQAGREQATAAGLRLAAFSRFKYAFASDLSRCSETAQLAFPARRDWQFMRELREIDFGVAEMCTADEVRQRCPELWQAWCRDDWDTAPTDGESYNALFQRACTACDAILSCLPEDSGAVVVSHKGMIECMLVHIMGWDPRDIWKLRLEPGRAVHVQIYDGFPVLAGFGI